MAHPKNGTDKITIYLKLSQSNIEWYSGMLLPPGISSKPARTVARSRAYGRNPQSMCSVIIIPQCILHSVDGLLDVTGCDAVYDRGWMTTSAGVFFVKPATAPAPFPVYCTRLSSGLMRARVAVRKDDTADFNRTWLEYRDGFGEPDSKTHWLGLERLHQFTKDGRYQARFQVKLQNSTTMYMYYENFVIGNESINYAFSVSLPVQERSLGDCLQDLLGAGFSAYDVDNDNAPVNCAQQHGAGWWFKGDNCSTCNPFGPIIPPYTGLRTGVDGEAFWTRNLGNITPLPFIMYLVL